MGTYPRQPSEPLRPAGVLVWFIVGLLCLVLFIGAIFGGITLVNAWSRSQARADAHNRVAITGIQIQNQRQYARVIAAHNATVIAQAQQRYLEAVGVRRAQDEISRTLTPLYIQHEAIQAEEAIANSGRNNTVIYVPASQNGVPIVTPAGAGK
jgi:hypothetical protein